MIFDERNRRGDCANSGKIDVHMVTHEESKRGFSVRSVSPLERRAISWVAAVVVPSVICAITALFLDRYLKIPGETAIFFVGVLFVALLGGVAPAAVSAVLSGLLLNYFLTEPRYTFTIAEPDSAITEIVLLLMAVAVAVLVDRARSREREARHASAEAELLTLFSGSVLRVPIWTRSWNGCARPIRNAPSVCCAVLGDEEQIVACVGDDPCVTVDSADTAIEVGDDEFWMLMAGRKLPARDRRC